MTIDSYRWISPSLKAWLLKVWKVPDERATTPFTPLKKTLHQARFSLLTTGGLFVRNTQKPFDLAREQHEPEWGDPSYREIPSSSQLGDIEVAHLHYNPVDVEQDFNIMLPVHRFQERGGSGKLNSGDRWNRCLKMA